MFKAKLKGSVLEISGLEAFIEKTVKRVLAKFRPTPVAVAAVRASAPASAPVAAPVAKAEAPAPKAKPARAKKVARKVAATAAKKGQPAVAPAGTDDLEPLLAALAKHPKKNELIAAGKKPDQLLRSLIPLYVGRDLDVNSGAISRFWEAHGVKYAQPNAAKALRQKVGFAKATKKGRRITPNGVKYVEAALSGKQAA